MTKESERLVINNLYCMCYNHKFHTACSDSCACLTNAHLRDDMRKAR